MAYKIAFFGAKPYDIASFDKINERYEFDIRYYKGHLNINNVVLTQGVDAVCIFVNDTADAAVIDALVANGVKLLALRCAGFNNVDLKAAKGKLPVVRVPAYSPYAVAEYSLALMLSLNRKIHRAYWRTRDGNFSLNGLMGFDMHGKTIGIIGTGKIALIRLLKGFGMRILAYDLYPDMKFAGEEGISYVSLDELYRESDIISLHCPLTDQTKYMIDKDSIDKMKEDGTYEKLAKRERLQIDRQRAKLEKNLGSIKDMSRLPSALFVVDIQKEANAVKEANRLNIPVIAMVDTCCDPTPIDYVIPANDDAAKSIEYITNALCVAIQEGLDERKLEKEKEAANEAAEKPATKKLRPRKGAKDAEEAVEAAPVEAAEAPAAAEEVKAE